METVSLQVEAREGRGKSVTRKIRAAGKLPGVVYGLGKSMAVTVDPRTVTKLLLEEGGRNKTLSLVGQGLEGRFALVKDYQVDPVKRTLVHVDFLEIDINKKIEVIVPLNFVGKAAGMADGGVMNIVERTISVRCLPIAIPKHVDVDVTALKIGDSIHFDDLKLPEGIEKANVNANPTLVGVVPPAKEEEAQPALTAAAEPEVITAKAPAEGEAAAAAAGDKKDEKKK